VDLAAGIVTPLDATGSRLLAGEIADMALGIEKFSSCRMNTIQEVKAARGGRRPGAEPPVPPVPGQIYFTLGGLLPHPGLPGSHWGLSLLGTGAAAEKMQTGWVIDSTAGEGFTFEGTVCRELSVHLKE